MNTKKFALPQPGTYLNDAAAMRLALDAAEQGIRGANPLVGAVILDSEGKFLTAGWHRGAGTAHAEADAINRAHSAGIDLNGAHMFVTLEPCNHTGRTGPCSHAIAQAQISTLTYAYADQTEQACGGAEYLRSQGIEVHRGLGQGRAHQLNQRWFEAQEQDRPWVSAKIASTLDGFIAAADGTSQWITGSGARADGHSIRARADAVLVGTQTVIDDNPALTARDSAGNLLPHQPLRVVMGQRVLDETRAIFADENCLQVFSRELRVVLDELHGRGIRHLMVEGGPTVIAAFLAADAVDEIFWYQAPKILGAGKSAVSDLGISAVADSSNWILDELGMCQAIEQLQGDIRLHLAPSPPQNSPQR